MRSLLFAGLSGALLLSSAQAENLLENASFELPKISGRTPAIDGGSPSSVKEGEKSSWSSFVGELGDKGGKLTVGMTDAIAHTGKQSLFVDFEKLTAPDKRGILTSDLISVKPEQPYRISLWGRLDRQRPLAMDERRPHMLVEIEYFAADQETQVGDTEYRTQMIPGNIVPGVGIRLLFVANKWNEYSTDTKSPPEAAFMKVTFYLETPKEAGETDGIIYLDDAVIEGERGTIPLTDKEETESKEDAPAQGAAPAPAATQPAPVKSKP